MQNNELTDTSTKLFKFGRKYINLFLVIIVLLQLIFSVKSFIFFSFIIELLFFALMVVLVWWVWHYLGIVKLLGLIVSPGNSRHFSDAMSAAPTLRPPAPYP